jgi:hypothetical protein
MDNFIQKFLTKEFIGIKNRHISEYEKMSMAHMQEKKFENVRLYS